MRNQRIVYGELLKDFGKLYPSIVALEADLGGSTMSNIFGNTFPERYFQMGIAEQNMASFAAGLALTGKIPFIHSFAMFVTGRCYEQIRQSICIGSLKVRVIGSSAGLSDFGDGATHQCIEDISLMNGLPNMTVLVPADANELTEMMKIIIDIPGPVYLRLNRNDVPDISRPKTFKLGEPQLIRDGKDIVIFATGIMVSRALDAADTLYNMGISTRVVNVSSIKPLNKEMVKELASGMRLTISAEEHSVYGGLGSIISSILANSGLPSYQIGIKDRFGQSAKSYEELLTEYNLTSETIVQTVLNSLS